MSRKTKLTKTKTESELKKNQRKHKTSAEKQFKMYLK